MNLKFLHGDKSRISTDVTPFNEGSFYVTHDGDMYVDMNTGTNSEPDNQRLQLTFNADVVRSDIISSIYPVGSIYMSIINTDPSVLFGIGTWERIEDCFLLAAGSKHSAGESGGEESVTLTVDQMPSHSHGQNVVAADSSKTIYYNIDHNTYGKGYSAEQGVDTQSTGGAQSHNNMPPYLTVYVWKRIV